MFAILKQWLLQQKENEAIHSTIHWNNVCHQVKFAADLLNHCSDMAIFRLSSSARPPYWICCAHIWTINKEYLVEFINYYFAKFGCD